MDLKLGFYFNGKPTAKVTGIDLVENMLKLLKNKFYRYDTCFIKEHELQTLKEAEVSIIKIIVEGDSVSTITAIR